MPEGFDYDHDRAAVDPQYAEWVRSMAVLADQQVPDFRARRDIVPVQVPNGDVILMTEAEFAQRATDELVPEIAAFLRGLA